MNKLFVVNKPIFMSSNYYSKIIKRKFKVKKAGFSGILDPFATGCLIMAFGQYPKLFQYIKKAPKAYRATVWLGATSDSLDMENIVNIDMNYSISTQEKIQKELDGIVGDLTYLPPKYSAKNINGVRAYELARQNIDFELKKITSTVFDTKLINVNFPFFTFDITVSEGSYIRSIAQELLERLGLCGTLSGLERLNEGKFVFDDFKSLNPIPYLNLKQNIYSGDKEWMSLGKPLSIDYFSCADDGEYYILFDDFFSIIKIEDKIVKYKLNKMAL